MDEAAKIAAGRQEAREAAARAYREMGEQFEACAIAVESTLYDDDPLVRAILDAELRGAKRMQWQPIETFNEPTALSSGNGVLVADARGQVGEAYFRHYRDDDDGWWWANTSWGDYPEPDRPAMPLRAWMLLPNPPATILSLETKLIS